MAVARQRPSTAKGVVFMLLEDEHGQVNLIIPPPVYEPHRAIVRGEPLLLARGRFERVDRNENVLVEAVETPRPARPPGRKRGRGAPRAPRHTISGTASGRVPRVCCRAMVLFPLALVWVVVVLVWVIRSRPADPEAPERWTRFRRAPRPGPPAGPARGPVSDSRSRARTAAAASRPRG